MFAEAFGLSVEELERLGRRPQNLFYKEIRIPKKHSSRRGSFRTVYKPLDQTLRSFQKDFSTRLRDSFSFPDCVHGFLRGRSIVTNAKQHLGRKMVITTDIENFFGSIDCSRVQDAFEQSGCTAATAELIAKATTLNGVLVQGANASPLIANLVARQLDVDFVAMADRYGCRYTRYADDLTISGDKTLPSNVEISAIVAKHSFKIRDEVIRRQRRGRKQYVTGLSVFDEDQPRLPRHIKQRLRLLLYFASRYGIESHLDRLGLEDYERTYHVRYLEGWIQFASSVEPEFALWMDERFEKAHKR